MPIPGAPDNSSTPLGDLLGGVNRPQLNAFVANSQARNGLVSAQTQEAMTKASQAQEQMEAWDNIKTALISKGMKESDADLVRNITVGANNHDAETALKSLGLADIAVGGDQSNPNPGMVTQGQQIYQGHAAPPVSQPGESIMPVGSALSGVTPQQTPLAAAQTAEQRALAGLNTHKDLDPAAFHAAMGSVSPDGQTALARAVQEGRLDPTRLNSRTAPIYAQMEQNTPGMNFNRLHADATLQSNATFQQRAMSVDMLPGLLTNVTSLGKKLNGGAGYNDIKAVGFMQKWANGELNDPDYTEYMTARNDTLLRLASVMRGVGMSDQAHTAEIQAMAPTLSPAALDAWLKGQMSVVKPLLDRQNKITHLGEPGGGTAPLNAPTPAAPAASSAPSLRDQVPGGAPPPPVPTAQTVLHYPNEAAARAAGRMSGDRVFLEDHGSAGTLD